MAMLHASDIAAGAKYVVELAYSKEKAAGAW